MRSLSALLAVVVALSSAASLWAQTPAVDALRALANQGDRDAQYVFGCMHDVGCLDEAVLDNGLEIDSMDDAEAGHWYRLAADQGHAAAQSRLGDFYHFGYGVQRDYTEAMRWYRSAAEQGGAVAQYNLGVSFTIGRGVPQDDVEAARWYRLAADQGYTAAQYDLGNVYSTGRGVPQDDFEAVRWYRFAAEQGHVDAQWNLGLMYEVGIGVPQDYVAAHMWLHLSASRRTSAGSNLDLVTHDRERVADKMNTGQFAEAQRLAREWDARHPRN